MDKVSAKRHLVGTCRQTRMKITYLNPFVVTVQTDEWIYSADRMATIDWIKPTACQKMVFTTGHNV